MIESLHEKEYLKSSDICLSAALSSYGYQIEAVDKQNPSKAVFFIKRNEELDGLIQMYFTHELRVEPMSFFNALKEIKTRLYNT